MVAVGPNLFYTVTLPCTLWFFDKSKTVGRASPRADQVLFIEARHIYRQVDRAHREWTPAQIGFLANLVRLYRGEALDFNLGGDEARAKLEEIFGGTSFTSPKSKTLNPRPSTPGTCSAYAAQSCMLGFRHIAHGGVITVRKNVALLVGDGRVKNAPLPPTSGRFGSVAH